MLVKFRNFYIGLFIFAFPFLVQASGMVNSLTSTADSGGFKTSKEDDEYRLSMIVGFVIQAFLGLLGVIFIVLIIYSGYNWMTAGGDSEKVQKAKNTLSQAIIGLIIVVSAYGLWDFILGSLLS